MRQKGFSAWIALGIVAALFVVAGALGYWYFFAGSVPQEQLPGASQTAIPNTSAATPGQTASSTIPAKPYLKTETFTATTSETQYKPGEKTMVTVAPEKLPQATQFKSFAYDQTIGKTIAVSGSCTDAYYTIVIFRAADDYKKNPAAAVFNQAFPCPANHSFSQSIDIKNSNVPSGQYYFFVADQGNAGTWYNPR